MTVTCITSQEFVSKSQKDFLYLSFCSLLPLDFLSSFYLLSVSIICNNSSLSFFRSRAHKYVIHLVFFMAICDHNLITVQHDIHLWCGPLRNVQAAAPTSNSLALI